MILWPRSDLIMYVTFRFPTILHFHQIISPKRFGQPPLRSHHPYNTLVYNQHSIIETYLPHYIYIAHPTQPFLTFSPSFPIHPIPQQHNQRTKPSSAQSCGNVKTGRVVLLSGIVRTRCRAYIYSSRPGGGFMSTKGGWGREGKGTKVVSQYRMSTLAKRSVR